MACGSCGARRGNKVTRPKSTRTTVRVLKSRRTPIRRGK